MRRARRGNYFEDFRLGQNLRHAVPRTIHGGDLSLYIAATGDRRPLHSSTEFAKSLGYQREVVHDLLVFHIVFGRTVADVSRNAVANLGYADVRFLRPVYPGDTLRAESEVIGLRETSSGKTGVVYVRTRGLNQKDQEVLTFCRWVLVEKRDPGTATGANTVPDLPEEVSPDALSVPAKLSLERFYDLSWATGSSEYFEDFPVGTEISHADGMTVDDSDHVMTTRLYQNNARVHFNQHAMMGSKVGERLVYGGHVISVAHALSFAGLENALCMAAWNSGAHANPTVAGDTIYAFSEVLDAREVAAEPGLGALRLRTVAVKNADPDREDIEVQTEKDGRLRYDPRVVLDLDYWVLVPRRP